ncbi:family 43 glycosylhydrolase [Bacillus sp. FJAT-28004]|uniref:family 43 glycosylhydrolase n=1 Tax=Bacillus sp. FJAT-28004 TaxID=1679165 RepID=UPI0006B524F0|nr:family 43 glycosylhydrolase [Bacillus sp. FJAT-28004]
MENEATIYNGAAWKDTNGEPIRAHGGWILQQDGYFYWFGEDRTEGRKVSCYRSSDLCTWENRGAVLTLDSKVQPVYYRTSLVLCPPEMADIGYGQGAVIERPKVLYNERTSKYVMWMHWENGRNYCDARCAVATSDTIDGEYVYHGSFNPIGHMSRDCTVFQDDDGTAYFISAARDNADLLVYRLSNDYLSIDELVKTMWPGQYREAPAVMKRSGVYFLVTSACTGWLPNQGAYAYSDSLTGRWSQLLPFGNSTTYDSQPAFIMPLQTKRGTDYLYVGDRWDPSSYHQSSYVFLPLSFPSDKELKLEWADRLTLDLRNGLFDTKVQESGLFRIKSCGSERYLTVDQAAGEDAAVNASVLAYLAEEQKWTLEQSVEANYVRLRSKADGRCLAVPKHPNGELLGDGQVRLEQQGTPSCIEWSLENADAEGKLIIRNRTNGKVLSAGFGTGGNREAASVHITDEAEHDPRKGSDPQRFEIIKVF